MRTDRNPPDVHSIATTTHGRVLVRRADVLPARGIFVGFHGYMENAAIQMTRLEGIPGADAWTLVAVQALHRFYRWRTRDVVASWMTREDREAAIADNIAYVAAALDAVPHDASTRIVYAGFSQGVAMAFRAAVRSGAAGIIAVGGDVPPELLADSTLVFPPVLLARGATDELYPREKFDANVSALRARGARIEPYVYAAAHEWTPDVSAAAGDWLSRLD